MVYNLPGAGLSSIDVLSVWPVRRRGARGPVRIQGSDGEATVHEKESYRFTNQWSPS